VRLLGSTHKRAACPNPILTLYRGAGAGAGAGAVREYFIAALQGVWDYAPLGINACGGQPASYNDTANGFMRDNATALALGRRQIKAQYVEFTDATFTVRKARARPRCPPPPPAHAAHAPSLFPGMHAAGRGLAARARAAGEFAHSACLDSRARKVLCCVGG